MTNGRLELGSTGVSGNWNDDFNVVGGGPPFELGTSLDHDLHPRVGVAFNLRLDPQQGLDLDTIRNKNDRLSEVLLLLVLT